MQQIEPLDYGKFYHIYNRGINSCTIFTETTNYEYFLNLYDKHISPVADTYAWVLMKNHFHFLVRIKDLTGFGNLSGLPPHQCFSNLFNAYAKAWNKTYTRHGSLFERPFKRKLINDIDYFRTMVLYIHNNPVHHGFTQHAKDYPWSSYLSCISIKPTRLQRDTVIGWFNNKADFIAAHNAADVAEADLTGFQNLSGLTDN
jgi:REP element-mobilizing transposase RayT